MQLSNARSLKLLPNSSRRCRCKDYILRDQFCIYKLQILQSDFFICFNCDQYLHGLVMNHKLTIRLKKSFGFCKRWQKYLQKHRTLNKHKQTRIKFTWTQGVIWLPLISTFSSVPPIASTRDFNVASRVSVSSIPSKLNFTYDTNDLWKPEYRSLSSNLMMIQNSGTSCIPAVCV